MFVRSLARFRPISHLIRRKFNSDSSEMDKILSGFSPDVRRTLRDKLNEMEKEAYNQAMPAQLNELAANTAPLLQSANLKPAPPPSLSQLRRDTTRAITALRREVFQRAMTQGLKIPAARQMADKIVEKASKVLEQKADATAAATQQQQEEKVTEEEEFTVAEKELYDFAFQMIDQLYTPAGAEFNRFISGKTVEADEKAEKIFGNPNVALGIFTPKKQHTPAPSGFWESMERRRTELTNRGAGHSNAFEEQIEWTEQGKMWPYPIDNEYLIGEEANVSFTEHIFLDKYVAEKYKHLPKSGPVAHFMELVCVGLSKNPYMTLRKKHDHLDAFADYFNPEHIEKIHRLHEEAEKQAAMA